MSHVPVLLESVLEKIKGISVTEGLFVDATFGRGGHTREILKARPDFKVFAVDCDEEAIAHGTRDFETEAKSGRLQLVRGNFNKFSELLAQSQMGKESIVGFLLDLGVSSPQLDQGQRGFSFYHEGPLDMRMDRSLNLTAANIVNSWSEKELNDLFHELGEVRSPFRVTNKILEARKERAFSTTRELADLVERTEGWRQKGHHPATNYFLALRLEVNQELTRVKESLPQMVRALVSGGRLLVITFHSLEDRIVKVAMKNFVTEGLGELVNKKVIQPTWAEKKLNPRARSAKLRVFERRKI